MILAKTEHKFSFPLRNSVELCGIDMDDKLFFDSCIFTTCKKKNNQFNVMLTFLKLISRYTLLRSYMAFILPHFNYCASVWHFWGARQKEKSDCLNKRILTFILKDYNSP